ncbi:hypothetical protein [Paraburkholderia tropica]|uniref:hypothetical protein n=1 Tax=Paraburkholderia tropica TaxID=92647 RepID=UPI002AB643FC|nr:hypothetical protein [Paraburkholderia tropica]
MGSSWLGVGWRWVCYSVLVLMIGPAIMLFAALALDSGLSFSHLAAEYYEGALTASGHPAQPGFIEVMTCPGHTGAVASMQPCESPVMSPVPVAILVRSLASRMRAIYIFSVVLSSLLLVAIRLCIHSYSRVPVSASRLPRENAHVVWANAYELEAKTGTPSLEVDEPASRPSLACHTCERSEVVSARASARKG